MTGNIVDMRGEKIITPTYFNYEIYMKGDENNVIRTYGFLIANGAFYGIGRGPQVVLNGRLRRT